MHHFATQITRACGPAPGTSRLLTACRNRHPQGIRRERPLVGVVLDLHPQRLSRAVPGPRLDPYQDRVGAALPRLESRGELVAVPRSDTVVVIRGGHQSGRITDPL